VKSGAWPTWIWTGSPGCQASHRREPPADSIASIDQFLADNRNWVIEGCYADLSEHAAGEANEMIFLNLSSEACIENAKKRPWEPHKYASKAEQDENLQMLLAWIADYGTRTDVFSKPSHERLIAGFNGKKSIFRCNERRK